MGGIFMKASAVCALILTLALSACGAPESTAPESAEAPKAASAPASSETEAPPPPVALESLEWKSDHVVLTLVPQEYEAGPDNLPAGFSLPEEAREFFLNGYAEEFGPEVLPLMQYDIATGDVNGDGEEDYIVSALPQVMYFGNSPAPAYLFYSQPDSGYRRAGFASSGTYLLLDTSSFGLPDRLYSAFGYRLAFNGADGYEDVSVPPAQDVFHLGGLLVSPPQTNGGSVRVPFFIKSDIHVGCYIAACFKSEAGRLENPCVWLTLPDGAYALSDGENGFGWDIGADLFLRPGAELQEGEILYPDEIQFVPAG